MQLTSVEEICDQGLFPLKTSIKMHPKAQMSTPMPIAFFLFLSKSSGAINLVVPMHTVV